MLSFKEWLKEEAKRPKKKDKKNGDQHNNQGSGEIGVINNQGQASRINKEVQSDVVHYFPEP